MSRYLITGGTGSLGNALIKKLLSNGDEIVVYSRDEYKQHKMIAEYNNPKLSFVVGDVRDYEALVRVLKGIDRVVHAAALKHVPVGETESVETIKTNVIGTMNVVEACKEAGVKKAVFTATDKACHPVNLYGATKMVGEKLFIAGNLTNQTEFCCVRYGNVVGSRGSVIEYILKEKPKEINATGSRMTRFWISLDQAVDLVMLAFSEGQRGDIIIPKAPSASVIDMFKWLSPDMKINIVDMRPGEKYHESMVNKDESVHTQELPDHFIIKSELFNHSYSDRVFEYTSENCRRLTKEEFMKLI